MAANVETIAGRYAQALLTSTDTSIAQLESLRLEFEDLIKTINKSRELHALLESKVFTNEEKWAVLGECLEKAGTSKVLSSFLKHLVSVGRADIIHNVSIVFTNEVYTISGIVRAEVEAAHELSNDQADKIRESLEKRTGKKVLLTTKHNPALVAGVRAFVDGVTIESTLAAALSQLKQQLLNAE